GTGRLVVKLRTASMQPMIVRRDMPCPMLVSNHCRNLSPIEPFAVIRVNRPARLTVRRAGLLRDCQFPRPRRKFVGLACYLTIAPAHDADRWSRTPPDIYERTWPHGTPIQPATWVAASGRLRAARRLAARPKLAARSAPVAAMGQR